VLTTPVIAEAKTSSALTQHFRKVLKKDGEAVKGTPKSDKKPATTKKLSPKTPTSVKRTIDAMDKTPPSKKRKVASMSEEEESEPDVTNFEDAGLRASIPRRSKSAQPKYADDDGADDSADGDDEDAGGKKFVAHKYTNFDAEDDTEDDWENSVR
jgi:hypothetical protein